MPRPTLAISSTSTSIVQAEDIGADEHSADDQQDQLRDPLTGQDDGA